MNETDIFFETEIASYCYTNGILIAHSKSVLRTVENIGNNVATVKEQCKKRVPLLIHLTKSPIPSKATRQFSTEQLPTVYTAMAMISKPGLAKFIMTLLFKFKPPPIPMRTFNNEEDAKQWLQQFIL